MNAINTTELSLQEAIHTEINGNNDCIKNRGAFFTKSEIVEFILDLIGYTSNEPLYEKNIRTFFWER